MLKACLILLVDENDPIPQQSLHQGNAYRQKIRLPLQIRHAPDQIDFTGIDQGKDPALGDFSRVGDELVLTLELGVIQGQPQLLHKIGITGVVGAFRRRQANRHGP